MKCALCDTSSQEKSVWAYWIYAAEQMIVSKQDKILLFCSTSFIPISDYLMPINTSVHFCTMYPTRQNLTLTVIFTFKWDF